MAIVDGECLDVVVVTRSAAVGPLWVYASIDKPEMNDKSLEATVAFQKAIQEAKPMEPIKAEKLEGAEKKKFIAAYRVDMIALQKQLLDMERHILEGDNKKARKIYDGLKALRDAAHKKYQ